MNSSHTILVIEDEAPIREIIYEMLEEADFKVITAENGRQGLGLAHEQEPDLILCDIMMPGLDGYEVLTHLRQNLPTALTPFIFLTARADRPDIRQGMTLGADDYLTKPFTQQELLDAVQVRLNKQNLLHNFYTSPTSSPLPKKDIAIEEKELRLALEREEFQLYYQPQINLQTGALLGAEALLRWHSPERGMVSPAEFIPLAEATNFILPLGEWVLQSACHQIKSWLSAGLPPLMLSVNLSSAQFNQTDLISYISRVLQESQVPPQLLGIELTESLLVKDVEEAIQRLKELRQLEIHVSIDDFGTGYASLGYLQHFPFDVLKIDRCFVRNIQENRTNAAITTAVIHMAHELNLSVIAEGVETVAEQNFLISHHCNAMQGFLVSPPLPPEEFDRFQATYRP
ncbi:MAG TPA: EAL domain-containing response regulator [Leptolyngbyaceae cyanobacterium]